MPRTGISRLRVLSTAGVALVVGSGLPLAAQTGKAASPVAAALVALDRGDAAEARPALAANAAESLFLLALGEPGETKKSTLAQAAALAPEDSWIRSATAGIAALAEERPEEAAASLRAALAQRNDKRLHKLLGDSLRAQADWDGALVAYTAATSLDPSYPQALLAIGDLKRRVNDFAGAFNAYNHAIDDNGRPLGALLGRATSRLQLNDKEGTLADLERAAEVARSPAEKARALMSVVYAHTYWRALPTGLEAAEQVVALWLAEGRADSAAAASNATGRVLLETGDAAAAESWYERGWQIISGSSLKPEEKTIWQVRRLHAAARIAAQRREFRRAQTIAEEARLLMETDAANGDHYKQIYPYLIGYIRWQERKFGEAIGLLEQADTDLPFIQYLIADCHARSRDRANARLWYERALASGSGLDAESSVVRPLATAWLAKNPAGS